MTIGGADRSSSAQQASRAHQVRIITLAAAPRVESRAQSSELRAPPVARPRSRQYGLEMNPISFWPPNRNKTQPGMQSIIQAVFAFGRIERIQLGQVGQARRIGLLFPFGNRLSAGSTWPSCRRRGQVATWPLGDSATRSRATRASHSTLAVRARLEHFARIGRRPGEHPLGRLSSGPKRKIDKAINLVRRLSS